MLSKKQQLAKRLFDIVISFLGIILFLIPLLLLILLATCTAKRFGLFSQVRVGLHADLFKIYKIRTMKGSFDDNSITLKDDPRLTFLGKKLRKYHVDEIPQLFNVFIGNMSLVGPRPDVTGYADQLQGEDRIILSVRPGITGPATLKFRNEEEILSKQPNPKFYNDTVIWPQKVRLNKEYVKNWSFLGDLIFIFKTIFT